MAEATDIRRLKLILEYDGTDFFGWQYQPDKRTVQGELERSLLTLCAPPTLCAPDSLLAGEEPTLPPLRSRGGLRGGIAKGEAESEPKPDALSPPTVCAPVSLQAGEEPTLPPLRSRGGLRGGAIPLAPPLACGTVKLVAPPTCRACPDESRGRGLRGGGIFSRVIGAGRTDSGVHALGQVAHVDAVTTLRAGIILKALNRLLPRDVRVLSVEDAPPGFHARFSAKSRTYRYRLLRRESALERRYAWHPKFRWEDGVIQTINLCAPDSLLAEPPKVRRDDGAIQAVVPSLVGRHSFKSFSRARPGENDYICNVLAASWESDASGATFNITADRFMHSMVRGIVGALIDLGRGYYSADDFIRLLNHPDKVGAVHTAPPQGLTLVGVEY